MSITITAISNAIAANSCYYSLLIAITAIPVLAIDAITANSWSITANSY